MAGAAALCGLLAWWGPDAATAAEPAGGDQRAEDKAAAQVLFDEGRTLMDKEQYDQACPKFAESLRLDQALGTQLNLARCYQLSGKTASAWILYLEAAALAKREGQPGREQVARQLAEELVPKLSKLTINVPDRPEGLTIKRGGTLVREAQWGSAVPVDPGEHTIEASAPGYKPSVQKVTVDPDGAQAAITIAKLELAPVEPKDDGQGTTTTDAVPEDPTVQMASGIAVGVVGLAGLGLGIAFGVMASGDYDESLGYCHADDPNVCSQQGVDLRDDALTSGNVSTAGFIAGGALLVAGIIVLATAPWGGGDAAEPGADAPAEEPEAEPAEEPAEAARFELLPMVGDASSPLGGAPFRGIQGGLLLRGQW